MQSKGVVNAEELSQQFGERLPGGYEAAARAMGMTTQELRKATEQGEVAAEDLFPKLSVELMRMANSGGQLEKAINNTNSALFRLGNNITITNARFNEAGFDKGMRDFANSMSDMLVKAEEIFALFGYISPALFAPFRALFEIVGAIGTRFDDAKESLQDHTQALKYFGIIAAMSFGWSRKLFLIFGLIPAALSNIAAVIEGEEQTWTQWATTLAGIAASLVLIKNAKDKVTSFLGGDGKAGKSPLKAAAGGGFLGSLMSGGKMKVSVVSFLGLSLGAFTSLIYDMFFGKGPGTPVGQTVSERFGDNLRVGPIKRDPDVVTIPERIKNWLQQPASEVDFLNKGFNFETPDWLKGYEYQMYRTAESQAITSGDITFNITGDNSKEIADEVLRVIHSEVIRPTSINDPSQEK